MKIDTWFILYLISKITHLFGWEGSKVLNTRRNGAKAESYRIRELIGMHQHQYPWFISQKPSVKLKYEKIWKKNGKDFIWENHYVLSLIFIERKKDYTTMRQNFNSTSNRLTLRRHHTFFTINRTIYEAIKERRKIPKGTSTHKSKSNWHRLCKKGKKQKQQTNNSRINTSLKTKDWATPSPSSIGTTMCFAYWFYSNVDTRSCL